MSKIQVVTKAGKEFCVSDKGHSDSVTLRRFLRKVKSLKSIVAYGKSGTVIIPISSIDYIRVCEDGERGSSVNQFKKKPPIFVEGFGYQENE